jgi:response regulator RpfG family c-di-GMP phosphodiesterase
MSIRSKHLYLVVLAQALCVAVGLWMHYCLVRSSAYEAVETAFWSELEGTADNLMRAIEAAAPAAHGREVNAFDGAQAAVEREQPQRCYVTLVDQNWRAMAQYVGAGCEQSAPWEPGRILSWSPRSDQVARPGIPLRGALDVPGGSHVAVVRPLPEGAGHLVVHRPSADVEAAVAPFVQKLLPVGAVTLLWTLALLSITVHLIWMRQQETLDRERARSSSDVLRQTQMLIRTRDALIFALAKLAGFRDDETGGHLERISAYSVQLASELRHHPKFSQQVTPAFVRLIGLSSILHDIGKVGIEDSVLRKPGKLTPEERQRMRAHTTMAGDCLAEIAQSLGSSNFLAMAREIAVAHHEHWDGGGYPHGLKGEAIPLSARIVAIADVYDALVTRRVYKDVLPHEQCVTIIRKAAGRQFDPHLVEAWFKIEGEFRQIATRYASSSAQATGRHSHAAMSHGQEGGSTWRPMTTEDEDLRELVESAALP